MLTRTCNVEIERLTIFKLHGRNSNKARELIWTWRIAWFAQRRHEESKVQSRFFDHFFEFLKTKMDCLTPKNCWSKFHTPNPYPSDISWKKCDEPNMTVWTFHDTHPSQNNYLLHGMTCQKFCSVVGSNHLKHSFTFKIREGISFFIMPPSCFTSVYPLNFLQVYMLVKALGRGACLDGPYFGNDLNLGLCPTL